MKNVCEKQENVRLNTVNSRTQKNKWVILTGWKMCKFK